MADHICPSTHAADAGQQHKIALKNSSAGAVSLPSGILFNLTEYQGLTLNDQSFYTPKQNVTAGTATDPQPSGKAIPKLFQPIKLRNIELQNRIIVSPMCQYSADNGKHTAWHLTHLGGIIQRGPGLTIIESTAVTPEGRITPEDSGLWEDSQIEPLRKLTEFAHSQGQHVAIQLNHAGRKSSTVAPWIDRKAAAPTEAGGWPDKVFSVSEIPYDENTHVPKTLTLDGIVAIKKAFVVAAQRSLTAGFDVSSFRTECRSRD